MSRSVFSQTIIIIVCLQAFARPEFMAAEAANIRLQVANADVVHKAIDDDAWLIIDLRPTDAFNGWPMKWVDPRPPTDVLSRTARERGGHIPSATNFPADWVNQQNVDATLTDEAWQARKMATWQRFCNETKLSRRKVLLYGFGSIASADAGNGTASNMKEQVRSVAEILAQLSGNQTFFYFNATSYFADSSSPIESYKNYSRLVAPRVIDLIVNRKTPDSFDATKPIKIVECSWGPPSKSYAKGHLPTAIHVNSDAFEPPPSWRLGDAKSLTSFATAHGFHSDDCIVVSGADPLAAHRLAFVLLYMGVRDVRILNGGDNAWQRAGYKLDTTAHQPVAVVNFGIEIPGRPKTLDTEQDVIAGLKQPEKFTLVDNRTWREHIGEISGYSYHNVAGRIPGAVYGYAGKSGSGSMHHYRNQDDTMRTSDQILNLWRRQLIDSGRHLSFMCGGGWRAAEVFNYATVIGIPDAAVYSDGWIGWSRNSKNPIATGSPSGK